MVWRTIAAINTVAICVVLSGCGAGLRAPVIPPTGAWYTNVSAPLDIDADHTSIGVKQGRASSRCILGLVATGDAGLRAAARNGGLQTVTHIDYEYINVLGIYQRYTTIARGE